MPFVDANNSHPYIILVILSLTFHISPSFDMSEESLCIHFHQFRVPRQPATASLIRITHPQHMMTPCPPPTASIKSSQNSSK